MSLKGDSPAIDIVVDESDREREQKINSGRVERRVMVPPETRPSSASSLTTPGKRPPTKLLEVNHVLISESKQLSSALRLETKATSH